MSVKVRFFALALTVVLLAVAHAAPASTLVPPPPSPTIAPVAPTSAPVVAAAAPRASSNAMYIGAQYVFTGDSANYGKFSKEGWELARRDINAAGGILGRPIEFIYRDSKGDPKESAAIAQEFCQNKDISFVLGDWSSAQSLAAMPIYDECKKILMNGSSSNPDLTAKYKYFFRTIVPAKVSFDYAARFYIDQYKPQRIGIIYVQNDYSIQGRQYFKDVISQKGVQLVADEGYQADLKDFRSLITSLKGRNLDLLLMASFYQDAGLFLQQAAELGFRVKFAGPGSLSNTGLIDVAGKAAEGVCFVTGFWPEADRPQVKQFVKEMNEVYGYTPLSQDGALQYDGLRWLADGIKRANSFEVDKVWTALASTKGYAGVTGDYTLGPDREPYKDMFPVCVREGKFQKYK